MMAPKLFNHLRKRGIPVWFLGVNSESDIEIAYRIGATAILTDKVTTVKKYFKEKNIVLQKIH